MDKQFVEAARPRRPRPRHGAGLSSVLLLNTMIGSGFLSMAFCVQTAGWPLPRFAQLLEAFRVPSREAAAASAFLQRRLWAVLSEHEHASDAAERKEGHDDLCLNLKRGEKGNRQKVHVVESQRSQLHRAASLLASCCTVDGNVEHGRI